MTITIADLKFGSHPSKVFGGKRAEYYFPNGYGASVITGGNAYHSDEEPYEIAVMLAGNVCYDTPITDDVLGYLTEEAANEVLAQIEALPMKGETK